MQSQEWLPCGQIMTSFSDSHVVCSSKAFSVLVTWLFSFQEAIFLFLCTFFVLWAYDQKVRVLKNSLFRFCNDLIELALNNEVEYRQPCCYEVMLTLETNYKGDVKFTVGNKLTLRVRHRPSLSRLLFQNWSKHFLSLKRKMQ